MGKKSYDAESIQVLEMDRDRVRQCPGIYIPDDRIRGAVHLVREAKDNADDEIAACIFDGLSVSNIVDIHFDEGTHEVVVEDNGRGMPHEKLRELCEVLNSSGKYNKGDDSAYKFAGGQHGVGQKLINFLSDYLIITSTRDGIAYTISYIDGEFDNEKKEKVNKKLHGTRVAWKLSSTYLKDLDKLKAAHIIEMVKTKAECCSDVVTHLRCLTKKGKVIDETYKGLTPDELIHEYNKPDSSINTISSKEKDFEAEISFAYDTKAIDGCNILGYFNYIKNIAGGRHCDALVDALQDYYKKYFNDTLSAKEKKTFTLKKEDIRLGLCGIVNLRSTIAPEFKGQVKEELGSDEVYNRTMKVIKENLKKLPSKYIEEYAKIIKNNVKARLNSLRARTEIKKAGNRLSNNYVSNYLPVSPKYNGDYIEIYGTEGLSAGDQVKAASFPFQEVYKFRGRVDNVIDLSIKELHDNDRVKEMAQVFDLPIGPNKRGNMKQNKYKILTDADVDGLAIQAGNTVICAKAFPEMIDEGRLEIVIPPLYSFRDYEGETRFAANNREYLEYMREQFSVENDLYINGKKMSDDSLRLFLDRNENYNDTLKRLADDNIVSSKLMELIMAHIIEFGYDANSTTKWDKMLAKHYSKQLKSEYKDGNLIISGIKDGEYSIIHINDEFAKDDRAIKFISLIQANTSNLLNYSIKGKFDIDDISIHKVFKILNKYKGRDLHRFKGLGEMSVDELHDYVMNLNVQKCKRITWGDVDKAWETLNMLHSRSADSVLKRRNFMRDYKPDIMDIDT